MNDLQKQYDTMAAAQYEKRSERRFELSGWTYGDLCKHWNETASKNDLHKGQGLNRNELIECIIDYELPELKEGLSEVIISYNPLGVRDLFVRTGVRLNDDNGASLDILRPDGTFFCRINISAWKNGGSVDVIPRDEDTLTALAWEEGYESLRKSVRSGVMIAVDVRSGPKNDK